MASATARNGSTPNWFARSTGSQRVWPPTARIKTRAAKAELVPKVSTRGAAAGTRAVRVLSSSESWGRRIQLRLLGPRTIRWSVVSRSRSTFPLRTRCVARTVRLRPAGERQATFEAGLRSFIDEARLPRQVRAFRAGQGPPLLGGPMGPPIW